MDMFTLNAANKNAERLVAGLASGVKSHEVDNENGSIKFNFNDGSSTTLQVQTPQAKVEKAVNAYLGEKGINDILESESIEVVGNNLFNIEDNETEYKGVTIKVENNVITMQGEYTGTTNSSNIEIGSFTFNEDMSLYVSWWDVTGATVFAIRGDDLNLNFNVTEDSVNGNIRNFTAGTKYTVYVKINKTTTPTYINPSSFAPMLSSFKPTEYESYQVVTNSNRTITDNFRNMMIDSLNQFKGKKLINFGDSIAYGAGNDGVSYAHIIAKKLGMSCMSFAKGGATVCQSLLTTNNVVDQVDSCTTENPDIILVEGGTNDISKDEFERSLGEMVSMEISTAWTDSITDDSKTTVAGSLEYIFKTLKGKYPNAIIMYISVHKMSSRKITRQKTVHDLFKEICDKWSIPFIDVYEKGGMNTFLANMCLAYTQDTYNAGTGDATHPNGDGYNTFYVPMIMNEIKKHMEV